MDQRAHWEATYGSKAPETVSWFQVRPAVSLHLIAQAGANCDTRIIDAGAGAARLVDHLLDAGFHRLTVLDLAAEPLRRARERLGARAERVRWVVADAASWQPDHPYDLWHDRAAFHFLTEPHDRARYCGTLAAALAPGGQAIIGTFALDGPASCSGLPVMRYDATALAGEFAEHFDLVEALRDEHTTPAGKLQPFTFCRLRRR